MAIRFDAAGDSLQRTTNLPSITTFTAMGWFRWVSTGADYKTPIAFGAASYYKIYRKESDGAYGIYNGSTILETSAGALANDTWYHLAIVVSGTGAGQAVAYKDGAVSLTHDGDAGPSASTLAFGTDPDTNGRMDGRCCALKVWDASLSAAEVAQEMPSIRPQRFANLNGWYPCFPGSGERARDYSGNGYPLTEGGTLTDEDPPPVSWGAPVLGSGVVVAAPAGRTTKNTRAMHLGLFAGMGLRLG